MRISICAPTPPVPRPAWASAAGSRATTPPGPIRHSAIGRPMRSTNHRRSRSLLRHRSVWQHDRHYSPQGDRPELRNLSRLSKLGGPAHSQVYDPLNGLILDALIAPYQRDERNLLVEHLATLEAGCLLLLDSGYPAFWVFAALQARKIAWCARVALDTWSVVRNFLAAGQDDAVVLLEPHAEALADCRARGLSVLPIRVRLIRVLLPTGEVEVLMTSLLACDDYPAEAFAGLYHLRWTQEECYKCFKCRVEVENWSGKSALTIDQDFHAKVLALNLTAVLARASQDVVDDRCRDDIHPKQVNMTHALCAMKGALIRLLTRSDPLELLRVLITAVAHTVEPIRPGRSSPRRKGPRLHGYHMAYKPCT